MLGSAKQARREVRGLTDDAVLLRLSRSDQLADDDQSSGDTNTGLQGNWRFECSDRRDQL
jgi:hypothetical protein